MTKPTPRRWVLVAIPTVLVAAIAACGGGGSYGGGGGGGGTTYTVGGMVTGLRGSGLVLHNSDGSALPVSAAGAFTFGTGLVNGAAYAVTVQTQPTNPNQICVVTNGSGTMGTGNVTNVAVACANIYSVRGTVTGFADRGLLERSGLVLQSNLGKLAAFAVGNPAFDFSGFASGAPYAVTVKTQPSLAGNCVVINGAGVMGTADVTNVLVECAWPTGHYAYAANAGENTISAYSVYSSGALIPIGTQVGTGTSPYAIVGSPDNKHLYVVNQVSNNISAYVVNAADGALTQLTGSPFPAGTDPQALAFDPSGAYLYVANKGSNDLSAYAVDATSGGLTPMSTATYLTGTGPSAVSVDPSGKFVYVANNGGSNDISVFAITTGTGALTQVVGSPFGAGGNPYSLGVVPLSAFSSMTFIYTANNDLTSSSISGFSVNPSTGALTALNGSPFALAVSHYIAAYTTSGGPLLYVTTGSSVIGYNVNPQSGLLSESAGFPVPAGINAYSVSSSNSYGSYVYVCNGGAASISAYSIDSSTGQLTAVPGSPSPAGNNPDFIAIL
jgi:6-phosphogluconolactonase